MAVAGLLHALLVTFLALTPLQAQEQDPARDGVDPDKHPVSGLERTRVKVQDEVFLFEIADEPWERARGLGDRKALGRNEGMIFVYPRPEILGYWMKHCLIDIDIIYVRSDGRIMAVHRMKKEPPRGERESLARYEARLPRYSSRHLVQFALEFPAGTIDRLKLEKGQHVTLPRERLLEDAR